MPSIHDDEKQTTNNQRHRGITIGALRALAGPREMQYQHVSMAVFNAPHLSTRRPWNPRHNSCPYLLNFLQCKNIVTDSLNCAHKLTIDLDPASQS